MLICIFIKKQITCMLVIGSAGGEEGTGVLLPWCLLRKGEIREMGAAWAPQMLPRLGAKH